MIFTNHYNMTFNHSYCATITIKDSPLPTKTFCTISEEMKNLEIDDELEIEFPDQEIVATYKVFDKKEEWKFDDDGNDTTWYHYIVKYVSGKDRPL